MLTLTANPSILKASFTYHFRHTRLAKLGLLSILVTLALLSNQVVRAQCITKVAATPGVCNEATSTYSTTAIVTLSNPVAGILTITDGAQSTTQITTATNSSTFTALFTGLISNGNSHTVTASLSLCNTSTATYTAPGSCTQPVGTQLSLTKLVDKSKAKIGDVMSYTMVLTNTGITTATNVVVQDSMSTGLTFVTGSATVPTGTTLTQGAPISAWKVASLSANQSFSLVYQATADSSGVLYNQATISGDTATVCTSIPILVCAGDVYIFRLTAKPGRSSYRWFKNDVELTTQTTNTLDITAPGTYSLAVDNVSGKCPDFSCCPFIVQEDTLPTFRAIATPATCVSNNAQSTGQIILSSFHAGYTYQYSLGTDFDPAASLSGPAKFIPVDGVIINNLANPAAARSYTVRVYNASGCYTDVTVVLLPTVCCSVSLAATPGSCSPITNTYSTTALVSLTNPVAGTLTLTDGPKSLTFATTAGSSVTFAATFDNLSSDGTSHTIIASLPGCSTTTATYTAPASCSAGIGIALMDPGACQPGTNTYITSGVISLTNAIAGPLTVTDGTSTITLSVSAGISSVPYSMSGLPSGTGSHTVTVSYLGYTISTTYTAPASCSVAPVCSINTVVTPGLCASATNTYSATAVITLSNPTAGLLTVTNEGQSLTFTTTASSSVTFTAAFDNLISDGASHTVVTSLSGCSTINTIYTAPASCSTGSPICSLSATASAGICATATNTYSASVVVSLINASAATITISIPGVAPNSQTIAAGTSSFTAVFQGLISDGASHTATISFPGCGTTTATFQAPPSCSVTPICSISAVATPGTCQSATNTFTTIAVINITNPSTGILTVTDGPASLTFATTAGSPASFTATLANIISNGASHTLTASLSGCSATTTTYTAPVSCSVAPVCSLTATATAGLCASATNTYSATSVVTLTNPTAGLLTVSTGGQSLTFTTTANSSATFTAIFNNLTSDGANHTVVASLPSCSTISTTYAAPASCIPEVGLAVTDPGVCIPGTNMYNTTGVISLTNAVAGSLTITDGASNITVSVSAGSSSIPYSMSGLPSGTGLHTVTVSYLGQTASTTYTAPTSCSIAPICSISAVATAGPCAPASNSFSSTVVISLTNPTTGTLTVSNGGQQQTLLTNPTTTSLTAVFANLISDGAIHTVIVSLPGCSTTSTTYTAPASCSIGIGLAVTDPGVCIPGTNTYNTTGVISLTNAVASSLTIIDGASSITLAVSAGASSVPYSMSGLPSGTGLHTVTVSYLGQTASTTYTAPASCSTACSLTAVATAIPVTCAGTMALQNGKIVISGFTTGDTYQYSGGVVFNAAVSLSGSAQAIPAGGMIVSNLANPVAAQAYTVRIYTASGCYKDSTVLLIPSVCTCPVNACVPLVVKQTRGIRRLRNP